MLYFLVILSIISVVISIGMQIYENWLYIKYINVLNKNKISGEEAAKTLLEKNGIKGIKVKEINGYLTDCYDEKHNEVRLSKKVFESRTIGAVAIAAKVVGQVISCRKKPKTAKFKGLLLLISKLSTPVVYVAILLGVFLSKTKWVWMGIFFEIVVLFIEFIILLINSKDLRIALKELDYSHLLSIGELKKCREVLGTVFISSIARFNMTILHIFRLISLIGNNYFSIPKDLIIYFWIFLVSCFLGFVVETIWCFIRNKKIESRKGVIYEPLIPIYGMAGVLIVFFAKILSLETTFELFAAGVIIGTIIEFGCSFFQEKIFGTKSWDYSDFPFNLNGRVNLLYSILFGIVTVILYKFILLPIINLFMNIEVSGLVISFTLYRFIFMLYDFFISAIAVYRMKERNKNKKRTNIFWIYIDEKYSDEFLSDIYPNMVSVYK